MKRLFQPLAVAALGLALFSCDKSEPMNRTNGGDLLGEPTRFEMSSSLGAVGIEPLSSNTDKADDELRANLHFRGLNSVAQTTLDAEKFGEGKPLQAYWAVKYANGYYSEPCPVAKAADLDEAEKVQMKKSTVCLIGTNNATIGGASVKMYTTTSKELKNITSSIMFLDGSVTNNEDNKVYFADGKSDPNHLIKGLKTTSEFQADRHIPIMTKLEPFAKMQVGGQDNNQVKFAPRGSLLGLNIKNTTGEQMIVTKIIVPKDGALYHRGHFEWASDGMPTFVGNNGSAAELAFPAEGTVANDAQACFYVWGFQDVSKKGEAFKVQIAYKTTEAGSEERTRTFSVYAPKSKVTPSEKMFDDGYAYKVVLTVNATNKLGGTAADWNDGGLLGNDGEIGLNPLSLVAKYDIAKVANTAGTNHTLQFAINPKNETDYSNYQVGVDVGYYTWAEAMRLFGYNVADDTTPIFNKSKKGVAPFNDDGWKASDGWNDALLTDPEFTDRKYKTIGGQEYYLPTLKEWTAIVPYTLIAVKNQIFENIAQNGFIYSFIMHNNMWIKTVNESVVKVGKVAGHSELLRDVQIGNDIISATEYDDEYITKVEDGNYVIYAIRLKGTKYESAWRYERKKLPKVDSKQFYTLMIKNVMLGKNSGKTLTGSNSVATPEFFNLNSTTECGLILHGYLPYDDFGNPTNIIQALGSNCPRWARTRINEIKASWQSSNSNNTVTTTTYPNYQVVIRPFKKN